VPRETIEGLRNEQELLKQSNSKLAKGDIEVAHQAENIINMEENIQTRFKNRMKKVLILYS
jgi:hypothetical protein